MSNLVNITHENGSSAAVHLFGATVTSWVANGKERLFVSSTSKMDGSKAVRGGIPVVFPNFGPWEFGPQHGFARISWWKVVKQPTVLENGNAEVILELKDSEDTRKMWDFKFNLTYKVTLGEDSLSSELSIENTGSKTFDFTTLLHTYIRVPDITVTTVTGFNGCLYDDKVEKVQNVEEKCELVSISKLVDKVYKKTIGHVVNTPNGRIKVEKTNLPDSVLWNPWAEKAAGMSDFDSDGYKFMVCVEPGHVAERKVLAPAESFACAQKLTVF